MENLEIIVLTTIVSTLFVVFFILMYKEFSKMEKEEYTYKPNVKRYGRDAVYDLLERLFDDETKSKSQKAKLFKTIDRTIADMESDGMYFSEDIKEKLEKEREELFCEYSGLPSPKAYERDDQL
jgi:ribosome assembly protein YihI (activator of Der GTPase)